MPEIPRVSGWASTRMLLRDPYRFISRQCRDHGTDVFHTRIAGYPVVCLTGPAGAELFYDRYRFARAGAAPGWVRHTLFGEGGVQGLDGEQHRHRKRLFTSLVTEETVRSLGETFAAHWRDELPRWADQDEVVLYDELCTLLTRVSCSWAGVPLPASEVPRRSHQLTALFDGAGAIGLRHWHARRARRAAQHWIESLVRDIRAGRTEPPTGSAAHACAWQRGASGELLSPPVAAVELLNVLRPIVAVAVYLTFVAHALHRYPQWRDNLVKDSDGSVVPAFVQEVRRSYPFFPAVLAVTSRKVNWRGYSIPQGRRVALDLYGTNHDPRAWHAPERFDPQRFLSTAAEPYSLIPQGGGDVEENHRCPGEPITTELMTIAVDMLVRHIDYQVPEQDLEIDYSRLPALPRSKLMLRNVDTQV